MSDEAVKGIRAARRRRERADRARSEATADLRQWIATAHAEGVSVARIAREAGLSRQGVYDALGDRQPS